MLYQTYKPQFEGQTHINTFAYDSTQIQELRILKLGFIFFKNAHFLKPCFQLQNWGFNIYCVSGIKTAVRKHQNIKSQFESWNRELKNGCALGLP